MNPDPLHVSDDEERVIRREYDAQAPIVKLVGRHDWSSEDIEDGFARAAEPMSDREWRDFMAGMDRNPDGTRFRRRPTSKAWLLLALGVGAALGFVAGWALR